MAGVVRVELGGGGKSGADKGRINIDKLDGADIVCDLDMRLIPLESDSVDDLYSAHCIEHLKDPHQIVGDILRVCRIGARVEIRVPHWLHAYAMCPGHHHVISDRILTDWCDFPERYTSWPSNKGFRMYAPLHYQEEVSLPHFRRAFPNVPDSFLLKHMPGCCHEVMAFYEVISR